MKRRYINRIALALGLLCVLNIFGCQSDDISHDDDQTVESNGYLKEFEELRSANPDVRAWLSIPGLDIEAPIMAHDSDNSYYNKRDPSGIETPEGSFYIEDYNSFDFTDPVTVVYGRNMPDGISMLGGMQESYTNPEFFYENNSFSIHTPDAAYEYKVIAAVPYSNRHILYYHDFESFDAVEEFVSEIYSTRSLTAVYDTEVTLSEGDKLCVLSAGFDGDTKQRFIVVGLWKNTTTVSSNSQ